jgi:hypothetical protein
VDNLSYVKQLSGGIPEGNNTPLFYVLQKSFCQLTQYQIPQAWKEGRWGRDAKAEIMLRVIPVLCMSLSIALVFFYFFSAYTGWIALYSLFIYASSYMLWIYWAEARPYPVIVLMTTVQSLLFLKIINEKKIEDKQWMALAVAHTLMAFTFIFSVGLIWAVSLILWFSRKWDWRKYFWVTIIPTAIAIFYYLNVPKYPFYFDLTPEQLIRDNMSRERFYILFIFAFFLLVYWIGLKKKWKFLPINQAIIQPLSYVLFTALTLLATVSVLVMFMQQQCLPNQGFPITSRYFIYLMPVGVIAATLMTQAVIVSLARYRWIQWAAIIGIALLVIPRFLKVVPKAIHSILGS